MFICANSLIFFLCVIVSILIHVLRFGISCKPALFMLGRLLFFVVLNICHISARSVIVFQSSICMIGSTESSCKASIHVPWAEIILVVMLV